MSTKFTKKISPYDDMLAQFLLQPCVKMVFYQNGYSMSSHKLHHMKSQELA